MTLREQKNEVEEIIKTLSAMKNGTIGYKAQEDIIKRMTAFDLDNDPWTLDEEEVKEWHSTEIYNGNYEDEIYGYNQVLRDIIELIHDEEEDWQEV